MKKRKEAGLDFVVDKLTNSIENVITGDSFITEIALLKTAELKKIVKKNGWLFNWRQEAAAPGRQVYKLSIVNNAAIIQGLISLEIKTDHVYMHLLENAPFNRGKSKVYSGVAGNLVAFACKVSFDQGYDGCVSFMSKTKLIRHYERTLGAFHFGGHLMVIEKPAALTLTKKYFKN